MYKWKAIDFRIDCQFCGRNVDKMKDRLFVIGIDMESRPVEDIAREASLKIAEITDLLIGVQKKEKEEVKDDFNII